MGSLTIRTAVDADARQMTNLLNEVIAAGGTTAHQRPFTEERMTHHYIDSAGLVSSIVAEQGLAIVGFQCLVRPNDAGDPFPDGWAIIATFARPGLTGSGIGTALFQATKAAAEQAGVRTIDATIRADNAIGLAYYSKMGFRDYDRLIGVPLRDGTKVDRIRKRLDLGA